MCVNAESLPTYQDERYKSALSDGSIVPPAIQYSPILAAPGNFEDGNE